jgi:hypothetical protein
MCDRVQLLEKASRQLEVDNERLAFKVNMHVIVLYIPHYFNSISMNLYITGPAYLDTLFHLQYPYFLISSAYYYDAGAAQSV